MSVALERTTTDYGTGSVRTRISWGAIAAGVAVALAIYTLLMSLGLAIGMSVSENASAQTLGTSAGVWGFIALLVSLFAGGWVTTQVTVGESRTEAMLYGVVLWATTSVLLFWLAANGVRAGVDTAMAMQRMSAPNEVTSTVEMNRSPEERQSEMQQAREASKEGSWWAFAGILMSMVAAIGGALVGPVELTIRRDYRHALEPHSVTR